MLYDKSNIAVIVPSYNEGRRIESIVSQILSKGFKNIIVVDDGSVDYSIDPLKKFDIVILTHLVNRGAGAATETGLMYCREILHPEAVVMIDADTQHDVDDIENLLEEHFKQNADITIGNRFMQDSESIPAKNIIFNKLANIVTSIFAGKRVYDSQSGFKVFNRKAIYGLVLEQDRYEHCSEIFIKAADLKFKVIDVPIKVYYPLEIKDKGQHFFNGIRTFSNLLYSVLFRNN